MSSDSENHKVALIGTGPISLLKAYLIAKKDQNVEVNIFDMSDQFGGAWYSDLSPKGHEIECGCHIWSFTPEVYAYFEKELGIKLSYFTPTPLFIGKILKLPYSTKNFIDSYKFIFKKFVTFRWKELSIKSKPNVHWKIFGKRNKYPETGSPELIHALKGKLEKLSNVQILDGKNIKSVTVGDKVDLKTDTESFSADQLFVTSVSMLDSVSKGDVKIDLKPQRIDYNHLLISLDKPLKRKISYWRLMNDAVIHRITDISYQTGLEENLLLVGIKSKPFDNNSSDELMDKVSGTLKDLKLIDQSYQLDLIKSHCYPTYYSDPEARAKMNSIDERIKVLHTTDLIYGMFYLLREEKII